MPALKDHEWGDGAAWRVSVRSEAATLNEELDRTEHWYQHAPERFTQRLQADQFHATTETIRRDLDVARQTTSPANRLRRAFADWWTGSKIEASWLALHRATQNLLLVGEPSYVRAQLPDIEWQIHATFADEDTRKGAFLRLLKDEAAKADDEVDRDRLRSMRRTRDQVWDAAHANLRRFRNTLLFLALVVLVVVGVLIALDLSPGLVPVCSGSPGEKTICPSGSEVAGWQDALTIAAAGVMGGLAAAATSLRRVDQSRSPYNVSVAQAVLKVPMGALTALFGAVLVSNQVLGLKVTPGTGQLVAYAALFGYAQQAFTRSVETRANKLLAATPGSHPPEASPIS